MPWRANLPALVVFGSTAIAVAVAVGTLRRQDDPMAWPLTVLMAGIALWCLPGAVAYAVTDPGQVLFWTKAQFVGIAIAPVAYLYVAFRYAGNERWFSPPYYAALAVVPVATVAVVWTNPIHHLYWVSTSVETVAGASVLDSSFGPWYWLYLGYAWVITMVGLAILGNHAIRADLIRQRQAILMFFAGLIPLAANVATVTGVVPLSEIGLTEPALAISGLSFAVILFHYDLLDLSPAAYRNVSDIFGDGVLVFDDSDELVECNEYAEEILDRQLVPGLALADLFDAEPASMDGSIVSRTNGSTDYYRVRTEALRDYREETVGSVVVLREVTDLKEHEQRLQVSNRILRHNLRNELNVIQGMVQQYTSSREGTDFDAETVDRATDRLISLSEKARYIQSTVSWESDSFEQYNLSAIVAGTVRDLREPYPGATIDVETAGAAYVGAPNEEILESVVETVIDNAIEHNDSDTPVVRVSVTMNDGTVTLTVADNGPGIPDHELAVIEEGQETQLAHSSGLGLWLVHWSVSSLGGDIEYHRPDDGGTTVEITLPVDSTGELAPRVVADD